MSQITSHILDTAKGKPAANVHLKLEKKENNAWQTLATGTTNADGRVSDLLGKEVILAVGIYKMVFDTEGYFQAQNAVSFYPIVEIVFNVKDASHYHIPLLLSPFGYTTYRGS